MKKKFTIPLLVLLIGILSSSTIYAYEYFSSYKYSNGVADGRYYNDATDGFDQEGTLYDFNTLLHQAVNGWNNLTEADFKDTTTNPNHGDLKLRLFALDFGELGLNGWALMIKDNVTVSGANGSSGPTKSWNMCHAILNAHDIEDDGAMTFLEARVIAYHEIGHCLGLAHEDDGTPAIMASGEDAINNGWTTIRADDISGVNNRY